MTGRPKNRPPTMAQGERTALFYALAAQEARAVLLTLAPHSPQARRCADAMERLTNYLWPDSRDRQRTDDAELPE